MPLVQESGMGWPSLVSRGLSSIATENEPLVGEKTLKDTAATVYAGESTSAGRMHHDLKFRFASGGRYDCRIAANILPSDALASRCPDESAKGAGQRPGKRASSRIRR